MTSSPFFDNICTLPLTSDLFAQALHPSESVLAVGLASGHVYTYRLPSIDEDEFSKPVAQAVKSADKTADGTTSILSSRRRSSTASLNGLGSIDTIWKTRRHKGSCRTLCYSPDGATLFSAGSDGIIKACDALTGQVINKITIPTSDLPVSEVDPSALLNALTAQHLISATDSGALHVHDLRQAPSSISAIPSSTYHPHGDEPVNDLIAIPPSEASTSGFSKQFITVGGTTLAVTDIRKGVVAVSDHQDTELSSVTLVAGLKSGGTSVGEKVLVGQADGVVSLWERGVWGDIDERQVVDRDQGSVDALVNVPLDFVPRGKLKMNERIAAAGLDDGTIRFVRVGRNTVIHEWELKHDMLGGVSCLDFDVAGRMVSGGGQVVKLWTKAHTTPPTSSPKSGKRALSNSGSDDDSEDEQSDESEEESESDKEVSKRKKRKRNKGKDKSGGKALDFTGL